MGLCPPKFMLIEYSYFFEPSEGCGCSYTACSTSADCSSTVWGESLPDKDVVGDDEVGRGVRAVPEVEGLFRSKGGPRGIAWPNLDD